MKGKSTERICLRFIFSVSGYRVSDPVRMCPDLILSAGFKIELYACIFLTVFLDMLECLAVAGCVFPVLSRGAVPVVVFAQRIAVYLQ